MKFTDGTQAAPASLAGLCLCCRDRAQVPCHWAQALRLMGSLHRMDIQWASLPPNSPANFPHISLASPRSLGGRTSCKIQCSPLNSGMQIRIFLSKEDVREGLGVGLTFEQCICWGKGCPSPDFTQSLGPSTQHLLISLLFPREFCVQIPFPGKEALLRLSWVRCSVLVQSAIAGWRSRRHGTPLSRAQEGGQSRPGMWVASFAELPKNKLS